MGSSPIISSTFLREALAFRPGWLYGGILEREPKDGALPTSGSNSVVESQPSKLLVAGSIPVSRSKSRFREGF
jgi:hypothetical protein